MNKTQQQFESIKKYAQTQGIPLDSPRVAKYAKAMGIDPKDLGIEVVENHVNAREEAAKRYAEKMGLPLTDPTVRKYASSGTEVEVAKIDIEGSEDLKFKEAVLHYANSQNLDLSSTQVQKYAHGLLGHTGDFNEEKRSTPESAETTERRVAEAINRYAERMGLPVEHETVQKYATGLKRATPQIFKQAQG